MPMVNTSASSNQMSLIDNLIVTQPSKIEKENLIGTQPSKINKKKKENLIGTRKYRFGLQCTWCFIICCDLETSAD